MKIIKSGIATIQDMGRQGFRNMGISHGGVMDTSASRLANMLVGNEPGEAVIEINAGAFSISCQTTLLFAVGGKGFNLFINERPAAFWQPHLLRSGDTLQLLPSGGGIAILAVHGGIRTPRVLESRSTNLLAAFGGWEGRLLRSGDLLPIAVLHTPIAEKIISQLSSPSQHTHFRLSDTAIPDYSVNTIRFFPGHHFSSFTDAARQLLESESFELTGMSNRMGYRFNGPILQNRENKELVSAAVVPGTMQVSPDGQLLVLMADAQTTGGYPGIGQVIAADLPLLAQHSPGSQLHFRRISAEEAQALLLEKESSYLKLCHDYELYFA